MASNETPILNFNSAEEVALKLMDKILIKEPVANNSEVEIIELYKRCLNAVKYPEKLNTAFEAARNAEKALRESEKEKVAAEERTMNPSSIYSFKIA